MTLHEAAEDVLRCFDEMADTETKGAAIRVRSYMLAIEALRAALAEPEAEPVAWMESPYGEIRRNPLYKIAAPQSVEWSIPLYAALAEPDGWRQCAKGQKTTQYCGLLEEAVKTEREACAEIMESNAKACNNQSMLYEALMAGAAAIRARGAYEAETL